MTKLGELREAEEKARQEVEKAEKEAQRIRMSLPDLMEEKSRENTLRIEEISAGEEEKVERVISELREDLEAETEKRMGRLASMQEDLDRAAANGLEKFIIRSAEKNP